MTGMFTLLCVMCCVVSGLCDERIARSEEDHPVFKSLCGLETSTMRLAYARFGLGDTEGKKCSLCRKGRSKVAYCGGYSFINPLRTKSIPFYLKA